MGGAVIPPGSLFGLELLSIDGWDQIFPKWPPPETHADKYFREFCLPCPSPTTSLIHSLFSQEILQELQSGPTRFLWSLCFALGPSVHESLCVPFKNGVSVTHSPLEHLCTSSTRLQCQMLQVLFLPMPDPQEWGLHEGPRTLTPIGEFIWYSYFPVCGLSAREVWGCLCHVFTPPTSWCGLLFVFWSRISFFKFPVSLLEGCSTFGYNFVVFIREVELQPYSAILILSPPSLFNGFLCCVNFVKFD